MVVLPMEFQIQHGLHTLVEIILHKYCWLLVVVQEVLVAVVLEVYYITVQYH
jgi:hypothetical protein